MAPKSWAGLTVMPPPSVRVRAEVWVGLGAGWAGDETWSQLGEEGNAEEGERGEGRRRKRCGWARGAGVGEVFACGRTDS